MRIFRCIALRICGIFWTVFAYADCIYVIDEGRRRNSNRKYAFSDSLFYANGAFSSLHARREIAFVLLAKGAPQLYANVRISMRCFMQMWHFLDCFHAYRLHLCYRQRAAPK